MLFYANSICYYEGKGEKERGIVGGSEKERGEVKQREGEVGVREVERARVEKKSLLYV